MKASELWDQKSYREKEVASKEKERCNRSKRSKQDSVLIVEQMEENVPGEMQ
jgi:hypothetical protein